MKRVSEAEADQVIELLALAFYSDPVWSWAFPDRQRRHEHLRRWWGLFVGSAVPHGWAWTTSDGAAAAVLIPPGQPELSEEAEAAVEPLLRELVGDHADDVLTLNARFEDNHPHDPPHYYLSLLGTHPEHRGQGRGMGLLAAILAETADADGQPAYLESSNRDNDRRYGRLGFELVGEFAVPHTGHALGCMWREPA